MYRKGHTAAAVALAFAGLLAVGAASAGFIGTDSKSGGHKSREQPVIQVDYNGQRSEKRDNGQGNGKWQGDKGEGNKRHTVKHGCKKDCGNNKPSVVPIPAAAWLFGSGLLGMAGIGYRRRSKAA